MESRVKKNLYLLVKKLSLGLNNTYSFLNKQTCAKLRIEVILKIKLSLNITYKFFKHNVLVGSGLLNLI